jgi:uncharacterized protein YecE (DUF72 family)
MSARRGADQGTLYVGTAGWSLPRAEQPRFPGEGTHLERYARVLAGAEINASFYRPIRPALYAKWAAGVPATFRFAVKVPKTITHTRRLVDCGEPLASFLDEVAGLGDRLGCLLVQLPPSLAFDAARAAGFLALLRGRHAGAVALEPRHATWFADDAGQLLADHGVARVAADPARVPAAALPGGAPNVAYYRLHGSPRMYWSAYDAAYLDALAARVAEGTRAGRTVWCIFDNTAGGAALTDALGLLARVEAHATAGH